MTKVALVTILSAMATFQLSGESSNNSSGSSLSKKRKLAENEIGTGHDSKTNATASPSGKGGLSGKDNHVRQVKGKSEGSDPNRTMLSAGDLTRKATSTPKMIVPPEAKARGASGPVKVQVTVDENGRVTSARALSGHPLLQGPALKSATTMKFTPTLLNGQSVKVTGTILITPVGK